MPWLPIPGLTLLPQGQAIRGDATWYTNCVESHVSRSEGVL